MLRSVIATFAVGFVFGQVLQFAQAQRSKALGNEALATVSGGCNNTSNKKITCDTTGCTAPAACTQDGSTCTKLVTQDPNICKGGLNGWNCEQTNSGNCAVSKYGTSGGTTCDCLNTGSGCGAQMSSTETEECSG